MAETAAVHNQEFFIKIEKACLFFSLFSIMFPLTKNVGFFCIAIVNIPMIFLALLWFRRLIKAGGFFLLRLDLWDFLLLGLGAWVCLSTLLVAPYNIGFALCWASMLFFGLYARQNIGTVYDRSFITRFAVLALCLQAAVSFLQLSTHSYIGSISRYFGAITEEIAERDPLIRVEGTLPQVNSLGMWIVMLSPFIYDRMLLYYHNKKYIQANFLLVLLVLCLSVLVIAITRWNLVMMLLIPFIFLFLKILRQKTKLPLRITYKILMIIFFSGILLLLFFSYAATNQSFHENFLALRMERVGEISEHLSRRIYQYKLSIAAIQRRPFLGEGFYNGGNIWQEANGKFLLSALPARPHNVFLLLAVENGLPALFIFFLAVTMPLFYYLRRFYAYGSEQDVFGMVVVIYVMAASVYLNAAQHWIWPLFLFLLGSFQGSLAKTGESCAKILA